MWRGGRSLATLQRSSRLVKLAMNGRFYLNLQKKQQNHPQAFCSSEHVQRTFSISLSWTLSRVNTEGGRVQGTALQYTIQLSLYTKATHTFHFSYLFCLFNLPVALWICLFHVHENKTLNRLLELTFNRTWKKRVCHEKGPALHKWFV